MTRPNPPIQDEDEKLAKRILLEVDLREAALVAGQIDVFAAEAANRLRSLSAESADWADAFRNMSRSANSLSAENASALAIIAEQDAKYRMLDTIRDSELRTLEAAEARVQELEAVLKRIAAGDGDYLAMTERDAKALAREALAARLSSPVGPDFRPARDHDLSAGVKLEGGE